jgi:hypothetical protein
MQNFWLENLKIRGHSEDLGVDRRIMLDWMLGEMCGNMWTGLIWLRLQSIGRLL